MGQAAAVLEGLKQEQPQGLGCCMSDYNFTSCWSWILFFTLLTPTSSLITAYPLTQLLYFFPSMSGPATSRDKISHPLDVSPVISPAISEWEHSCQLYRRKRGHRGQAWMCTLEQMMSQIARSEMHSSPHLSRFLPGHNCRDTPRYPGWETVHTLIYNIPLTLLFLIPWLHNSLPWLLTEALYLSPSSLLWKGTKLSELLSIICLFSYPWSNSSLVFLFCY